MECVKTRIHKLQNKMQEYGLDAYIIPTSDHHNSEYVSDYYKAREYFSGFTGSNGTLVVTKNEALLWTDGRYFIQAEQELTNTGIILCRIGEKDVPTILEYLQTALHKHATIGANGRILSTAFARKVEDLCTQNQMQFEYCLDLVEELWTNRPLLPCNPVSILPDEVSGMSVRDKLFKVRDYLRNEKAEATFINKLDDVMWLFNIRGKDIEYNPVALSYGYIDEEKAILFLQEAIITEELIAFSKNQGFTMEAYEKKDQILKDLLEHEKIILVDERHLNFYDTSLISKYAKIKNGQWPTEILKAVKNEIEQKNLKNVFLKDSVAVTKFLFYLKTNRDIKKLTELSVANYLQSLRKEIPDYRKDSFATISAYQENAAMMHYEPSKEREVFLNNKGMLLVDSGGQYQGGTTDVTRTIVLGKLNNDVKKHYTAVARGMINLSFCKFLHGCTGRNLDILARQPLWEMGVDYKCGTGHGIGYMLNVHEGPHAIRFKSMDSLSDAVFEEGMLVTNEPGVYRAGEYGIRIENVMLCKKAEENSDGQFMEFETLTYVPIDIDGIDSTFMSKNEIEKLNSYHQSVYEKICPYLNKNEEEWLFRVTRPI